MKKQHCKQILSVAVALVMVLSVFCFTDLGWQAEARVVGPQITFYVPETIYRDPSGTGYQYFVDSDARGELVANPAKTSGLIAFSSADPFTDLTIRRSDIPTATYSKSSGDSFQAEFSDGNAAAGSVITWTADYVVDGTPYRSVAHSYVYEPNITQSGVLWQQAYNGTVTEPEVHFFLFLTGFHTATGGDMKSNFVSRSATDPLAAPLVKYPPENGISSLSSVDKNIIPSTGSNAYFTEQTNGGITRVWNGSKTHDKIWPVASDGRTAMQSPQVATITVDTSRYSNYSQIPNLRTGYSQYYYYRDGSGNYIDFIRSASAFTDSDAEDAMVNGTSNITALDTRISGGTTDKMSILGLFTLNGTLPAAGTSRTDTIYVKHKNGYSASLVTESIYCVVGTSLTTIAVNKNSLRRMYRTAIAQPVDFTNGQPTDEGYTAFMTALAQAGKTLGDPTASQSEITSKENALRIAFNNWINLTSPTFKVTAGRAKPGETVQVTVSTLNNPGIIATRLHLSYDPDVLTLTAADNGNVFSDASFQRGGDLSAIPFNVLWKDAVGSNHTANDVLVTYTFLVADDAPAGQTAITLEYDADSTFDRDLESISFNVMNDSVEVYVRTPGDSDGDGSLDLKDVVAITRYLVGGWGVEINAENADVDRNGKVTLRDAVLIERYLAEGWDVELY